MLTPDDLTCKEFVELVTDYLEGKPAPPERARLEAHLAGCEGCGAYLEQMEQVIDWMGQLADKEVSAEAKERMLLAFRKWRER